MRRIAFIVIVALWSMPVLAQPARRAIFVEHKGDDSNGRTLAFELREAIRTSAGYVLAATKDGSDFAVLILTFDVPVPGTAKDTMTAMSCTFTARNDNDFAEGHPETWLPLFMDAELGVFGRARVSETARALLASLDHEVVDYSSVRRDR